MFQFHLSPGIVNIEDSWTMYRCNEMSTLPFFHVLRCTSLHQNNYCITDWLPLNGTLTYRVFSLHSHGIVNTFMSQWHSFLCALSSVCSTKHMANNFFRMLIIGWWKFHSVRSMAHMLHRLNIYVHVLYSSHYTAFIPRYISYSFKYSPMHFPRIIHIAAPTVAKPPRLPLERSSITH